MSRGKTAVQLTEDHTTYRASELQLLRLHSTRSADSGLLLFCTGERERLHKWLDKYMEDSSFRRIAHDSIVPGSRVWST